MRVIIVGSNMMQNYGINLILDKSPQKWPKWAPTACYINLKII